MEAGIKDREYLEYVPSVELVAAYRKFHLARHHWWFVRWFPGLLVSKSDAKYFISEAVLGGFNEFVRIKREREGTDYLLPYEDCVSLSAFVGCRFGNLSREDRQSFGQQVISEIETFLLGGRLAFDGGEFYSDYEGTHVVFTKPVEMPNIPDLPRWVEVQFPY